MLHTNRIIRAAAVSFAALTTLTTYAAHTASATADARPAHAASGAVTPRAGDPGPKRSDSRPAGAEIFQGQAFDTCHTPSSSVMRAWDGSSPFGAVGVYIGGRARACPHQPHLDGSWVRAVDRMGWKLLPVYVGSQSPCVASPSKHRYAMSHTAPAQRGAREGRDAVAAAKRLGMAKRSAIYLDMESYDNSATRCAATTLRFVQGWNRAVRHAGYHPGFYSSANAGIEHMEGARKAGRKDLPEALWFAQWRTPPNPDRTRFLDDGAWQPHRRIHQYDGNVSRTYGGHRLNIDRNAVDAPVAVVP